MRLRRRGLASINSEVRDGILPAADGIARVALADDAADHTPRNYRVTALIIACALFMEQMDATILSTALLLEHLGRGDEARRVEQAVAEDLASRGDATRSTSQIGDAIAARL